MALVTTTQVETLKQETMGMHKEETAEGMGENVSSILPDIVAEKELLDGWRQALENLHLAGSLAGILHIKNDSLADVVQCDEMEILLGRDYFYEELLGMKFCITPFSFFQTNSLGAEVLYETVREYVGDTKDKVVFDLYSGTGTIAQITSAVAARVVGVEIVEETVEAARENARRNGLDNCVFVAGSCQ